jgi:hypothetical protein
MKVECIELAECEGCPYRSTEVLEDVFYAADTPVCASTSLRCRNYYSCKRIADMNSGSSTDTPPYPMTEQPPVETGG